MTSYANYGLFDLHRQTKVFPTSIACRLQSLRSLLPIMVLLTSVAKQQSFRPSSPVNKGQCVPAGFQTIQGKKWKNQLNSTLEKNPYRFSVSDATPLDVPIQHFERFIKTRDAHKHAIDLRLEDFASDLCTVLLALPLDGICYSIGDNIFTFLDAFSFN
ncbi:hypothetical protein M5K25_001290 [Dendrobium thyrsiflorum]|uniref:Uncharacterized protein n=1 Tax=Dendrobium thyrsiflorum TaxID=117978 RepID=A0ABD0VWM5_DENTH